MQWKRRVLTALLLGAALLGLSVSPARAELVLFALPPEGSGPFTYTYEVHALGNTALAPAGGGTGALVNPGNWAVVYQVAGLTTTTPVTLTGDLASKFAVEITPLGGPGVTPPGQMDFTMPPLDNLVI